jgi:NAD(P)-dependent dehydrogenase (short-subunit alcohol dehydrogenase family)
MEAVIADLKATGLTILLIEHKLDMVMRLSDRVLAMDDGNRIAEGAPNEVRQAAYAASKGALTSAMYSLAREVGPDRIRVNSVQPGWMWGPAVAGFVRGSAAREGVPEEAVKARLAKRMALPEPAGDDDVAEAALFFASDRARAITGQQLLVNAGEFMR